MGVIVIINAHILCKEGGEGVAEADGECGGGVETRRDGGIHASEVKKIQARIGAC